MAEAKRSEPIDLVLKGASEVLTMAGDEPDERGLGVVKGGTVLVSEGKVVAVGDYHQLAAEYDLSGAEVIPVDGQVVTPGLVDPHTHLVFAGSREDEFARRIAGATYSEIAESGGGIIRTVQDTRAAGEDELYTQAALNLEKMILGGATTVEVKSGYGLTLEDEMKLLRVANRLRSEAPIEVVPTFLGAHEVPPEFEGKSAKYVELVARVMVPEVARSGLAEFCDVFCEKGVFSVEDSRQILEEAKKHGLLPKLHADELGPFGGAELAAEVGAVSADHLLYSSEAGLEAMAKAGTVAVLLPGTPFTLLLDRQARAREMLRRGVTVAVATDFNPGTSPIPSMEVVLGLACRLLRLTPGEALRAATRGSAMALRRGDVIGRLTPGMRADLVVWDVPSHASIPYYFGANLVRHVIAGGKVVVWNGRLEPEARLLPEEDEGGVPAGAPAARPRSWKTTLTFFLIAALLGLLTRWACQGPR
ncbi:MAG TPA: imidazolonepropionase [Bacillota bacterium]